MRCFANQRLQKYDFVIGGHFLFIISKEINFKSNLLEYYYSSASGCNA
jgi:hypothetical protein